ncbi:MAG: FecR domain-containing protein [Gelidibacter sp.]
MDKDYLLKQWLNNALTADEEKAFKQLEDYEFYKTIVDDANYFKVSDSENKTDFETFKAMYESRKKPIKKLNWLTPIMRIASIVVIALGIYFTFFNMHTTEVKTLAHETTTVKLPDNSLVTLNASTKISFNKNTWNNHRTLKLNGEAYFKVQKGKTFDVITSDGVVTVVGTQFNVKQRNAYYEVQCYEGVVKVVTNHATNTLYAGDTYRIINNQEEKNTTPFVDPQWTHGKSSFNNVPLSEVLDELERQYNIKITLIKVTDNRLFTGGFTHNDLESALKSVTQPMDLTYDIHKANEVVIHDNKE